jgi:hypothetical protein
MTATSARGLFAATGNALKPKPQLLEDGTFILTDRPEREKDDFNATPPEPIITFLRAERGRLLELGGKVWEASAGDGALVREMRAIGLDVYATDLVDRGFHLDQRQDYYEFDDWPLFEDSYGARSYSRPAKRVTVQNPPFQEANIGDAKGRWIKHTRETLKADYAAMLLPLAWCGPAGQSKVWDLDPPARVYVMRWRIDWTGEGGAPSNHAWFIWDGITALGDTKFLMLDKSMDARQSEMF